MESGSYGYVFWSALQFSLWCGGLQSVTEEKKIANVGEGQEVEVKDEEVFEV